MHHRSILRAGSLLALGSTLLLAACAGDQPVGSDTPFEATAALSGADLARSLAAGLADAGVRAEVHAALVASTLNEHKLVLQEFVATPAGQRLLAAAAERSGVPVDALLARVRGMPETDFYLPVRQHRASWRAQDAVTVGFTADADSPLLTAWDAAGARVQLDARDGVPAQALLILHPGEPKWTRPAAGRGGERTPDGVSMYVEAGSCDPETALLPCDGGSGGGGGGGTLPPAGPVLNRFYTTPGDGWGDSEVLFRHYYMNLSGQRVDVWSWTAGNVEEDQWRTVNQPTVISSFVEVIELDSGGTLNDDYWGAAQIAASGAITNVYAECTTVFRDGFGQLSCNSPGDYRLTAKIVYYY